MHGTDEIGVKGEVTSRFEVNIKKLKGVIGVGEGRVTTQLNMALGNGRERDVLSRVARANRRSIDDKRTTVVHIKIIAGDTAISET